MANQLKVRTNVEDGTAGVSTRSRALAVAAAAGSQVLAFPAAAQELSACEVCGAECGNPIFYPEDGSCPNPIFYPESLIAIGGALVVGVIIGAWVCYKNKNGGSDM